MPAPSPIRARIRMYQVGFGDCFLLTFEYSSPLADGRSERHLLIDFGAKPRRPHGPTYPEIARLIAQHTHGRLDVIVATHRHEDHIGGFANKEAAAIIHGLQPGRVIRSWTEDPDVGANAIEPAARAFVAFLRRADAIAVHAERVTRQARASGRFDARHEELEAFAGKLKNKEAVRWLADHSKDDAGAYVHAGASARIGSMVPGVTVRVIGPPTVKQYPEVARQRDEDAAEFWMARARARHRARDTKPSRGVTRDADVPIGPVRTLVLRLHEQDADELLAIVRSLDDAMNNTSVILYVEAGTRRLLFPGDAQIENWEYTLKKPAWRKRLGQVDLYKVGHHGSRNATPKTLFGLWLQTNTPMTAMMSTMPGVHGESEETRVPRSTLVDALKARMKLLRTDPESFAGDFIEVEADLRTNAPYTLVQS